jgi:hypothetical protein
MLTLADPGQFPRNYFEGIKQCEVVEGLFKRPGSWDGVGPDDLFGIATCSAEFAAQIDDYLRKTKGTYNILTPGVFDWRRPRSWFFRFPGLLAHIRLSAGRPLNLFYQAAWAAAVYFAAKQPTTNQDGWRQSYLMCVKYYESPALHTSIMDMAFSFWKSKRTDVSAVYGAYIGDVDHPLCTAARECRARVGF